MVERRLSKDAAGSPHTHTQGFTFLRHAVIARGSSFLKCRTAALPAIQNVQALIAYEELWDMQPPRRLSFGFGAACSPFTRPAMCDVEPVIYSVMRVQQTRRFVGMKNVQRA